MGKTHIKAFCQHSTLNVTRDIIRSLKAPYVWRPQEIEAYSTEVLKSKKATANDLLDTTAQRRWSAHALKIKVRGMLLQSCAKYFKQNQGILYQKSLNSATQPSASTQTFIAVSVQGHEQYKRAHCRSASSRGNGKEADNERASVTSKVWTTARHQASMVSV